jgi:hypothetical protein
MEIDYLHGAYGGGPPGRFYEWKSPSQYEWKSTTCMERTAAGRPGGFMNGNQLSFLSGFHPESTEQVQDR